MKTALSIAGSDPSGGAGIQADIKTMMANGVYAMTAVTALTAQNTTGVLGILEVTPDFLTLQLDSVFSDIFPDAVKTGMVASAPLIEAIADRLTAWQAKNIVVDPVMVATSGSRLLREEAMEALRRKLLPLAAVITPAAKPSSHRRRRARGSRGKRKIVAAPSVVIRKRNSVPPAAQIKARSIVASLLLRARRVLPARAL